MCVITLQLAPGPFPSGSQVAANRSRRLGGHEPARKGTESPKQETPGALHVSSSLPTALAARRQSKLAEETNLPGTRCPPANCLFRLEEMLVIRATHAGSTREGCLDRAPSGAAHRPPQGSDYVTHASEPHELAPMQSAWTQRTIIVAPRCKNSKLGALTSSRSIDKNVHPPLGTA